MADRAKTDQIIGRSLAETCERHLFSWIRDTHRMPAALGSKIRLFHFHPPLVLSEA